MKGSIARFVIIGAAALTVAASGGSFEAAEPSDDTTYHITDLRSLGGRHSRGNAINDWGLVAGYSNLEGEGSRHATVWLFGHKFDLGTLGGTNSSVPWPGQNNRGLVVGIAQTRKAQTRSDGWSCRIFFPAPDATRYTCLGFVWEGGRMKRLPTLGGHNGFAASANNKRQVVGWAETAVKDPDCANPEDRGFQAVIWDLDRNRIRRLPPFEKDGAGAATAINDRGQVVGISGTCDQSVGRHTAKHAVLWENGTVKHLGNVGGDAWNTPTAITQRGDIVVGFAGSPGDDPDNPRFRAWLWTERDDVCAKLPGTDICDLGPLDVGGTAQAWGVNEPGQVVGTSCPPIGNCKAFLWENGAMTDLNSQKGGYLHHLENAMDINNRGEITGRSLTDGGERLAFVATPTR
jgi:probable HAF family extracellular repeat protein